MGYIYPKKVLLAYLEFKFLFARSGNPACYRWAVCPWAVSLWSPSFPSMGWGWGSFRCINGSVPVETSVCGRCWCDYSPELQTGLGCHECMGLELVSIASLSLLPASSWVSDCVCVFSRFSLICMECDPGTLMLCFPQFFCLFFPP